MLGQTLAGRYKLTRILGAGGFGQTYLAIDTHQRQLNGPEIKGPEIKGPEIKGLGIEGSESAGIPAGIEEPRSVQVINQCVVKQLQPASQDTNFLSVARRLFETEVKTLKRLGSHAQIPQLLDSFEEDNEFYLVQEYIDGQSLEDEIKELGHLDETSVISLLEDVLPILAFIHTHHVVHRDLKPDNLIRRRDNGKIVLIDFGAVKEIRTKLITGEQTALTIGIGTQGYTPSEQLSGKPRYSSDIYALGMTAIHALTGKSPTDLPEDFNSLDPRWQDYAEVSPGLSILLSKMTRHYIYQRYSSVEDVTSALSRLEELPVEAASASTYLETSIPEDRLVPAKPTILRWRMGKRAKRLTVAIATLLTSTFVLGVRHTGGFVYSELAAHDWLVSQQEDLGEDDRLVLIGVNSEDMRSRSGTLSDETLAIALENIQKHDPAVVGVEMLRSLPQGAGEKRLQQSLKSPNVIVTTQLDSLSNQGLSNSGFVPPPPGVPLSQISFNNIVIDSDFRVRRSHLVGYLPVASGQNPAARAVSDTATSDTTIPNTAASSSNISSAKAPISEVPIFSFAAEIATQYLAAQHDIEAKEGDILQLGNVSFKPISSTFGAYKEEDTERYQIFTDYRSPKNAVPILSLSDVLDNSFDLALLKNKVVLIGYTKEEDGNMFLTAYSTGGSREEMSRVVIHAQVISQILSSVLEGEPVPWSWPDWAEIGWIISLTGIGSILMVLTQRGPVLIAFGVGGLLTAYLVSMLSFQAGGWVPMTAPMSAFFLSAAGARISKSYQRRHWEAHQ